MNHKHYSHNSFIDTDCMPIHRGRGIAMKCTKIINSSRTSAHPRRPISFEFSSTILLPQALLNNRNHEVLACAPKPNHCRSFAKCNHLIDNLFFHSNNPSPPLKWPRIVRIDHSPHKRNLLTHADPKTQPKKTTPKRAGRSAISDVVAREYTIHLHKRVCLT